MVAPCRLHDLHNFQDASCKKVPYTFSVFACAKKSYCSESERFKKGSFKKEWVNILTSNTVL